MKKNNFEFMRVKSKENFERIFIKLALKKNVSLNKSWSISDNKVFLDSAKKVNLRTIDLKTNDKIGGTNLVKNESRIKKIILGHNL